MRNRSVVAVLMLGVLVAGLAGGCASDGDPVAKAKTAILIAVGVLDTALTVAQVFIDDTENVDEIRQQINAVASILLVQINLIQEILAVNSEVSDYATEHIAEMKATVQAFETKNAP